MTDEFIEKLANKLGVTIEHLWGILLKQAPITGMIDLIFLILASMGMYFTITCIYKKTNVIKKGEQWPEWTDDTAWIAWILASVVILFCFVTIVTGIYSVIPAFTNPEYWALKQLLKH